LGDLVTLSDHFDNGGFCSCCGTLWPCAVLRRAFLEQRAAPEQETSANPWFADPQ